MPKRIKPLPSYDYIKPADIDADFVLTGKTSVQEQLLADKPQISVGNKKEQEEACIRANDPGVTKLNNNEYGNYNYRVEEIIKYEPVITPFKIFTNFNINGKAYDFLDSDKKLASDNEYIIEQGQNNFTQSDIFILSSWLRPAIDPKYEISYLPRVYEGIERLILVLLKNNEVHPMTKEEAEQIQILVDQYSYNDKALLIDLDQNLVLDNGQVCNSHWLKSILPFLKVDNIFVELDRYVVTDNVYLYDDMFEILMQNIKMMYEEAYITAILLFHKDIIKKWDLLTCDVDIDGVDPNTQIVVHPKPENKISITILENQLAGDKWIDFTLDFTDNSINEKKHGIALILTENEINFKFYENKVYFETDNLIDMKRIITLIEQASTNYIGTVIDVGNIDIKENSKEIHGDSIVFYKDFKEGNMRVVYSIISTE